MGKLKSIRFDFYSDQDWQYQRQNINSTLKEKFIKVCRERAILSGLMLWTKNFLSDIRNERLSPIEYRNQGLVSCLEMSPTLWGHFIIELAFSIKMTYN